MTPDQTENSSYTMALSASEVERYQLMLADALTHDRETSGRQDRRRWLRSRSHLAGAGAAGWTYRDRNRRRADPEARAVGSRRRKPSGSG